MKVTAVLNSGIYAARSEKIDKHIEIVSSTADGLSSMGKESRQAVYEVLTKHYTRVGITIVNTISDLEELAASEPDLVFLGMKYLPDNPNMPRGPKRIWLSTYLDDRNIAYTGSSQSAHQLELNKALSKQRMNDENLSTSPFYVAVQNQLSFGYTALSFPLFVKPTDRGGGQGIDSGSVVRSPAALQLKISSITANHQADSLVEEFLPGREFSVAILKNQYSDEYSVMPVELVAKANEHGVSMLGSEVKSSNTEVVSLVTDKSIRVSVCGLALAAFHTLGARDYGRIDIRLDKFGVPHFLEANLLPSLISDYGSFPKACLINSKLDYEAMILSITALGFTRDYTKSRTNLIGAVQEKSLRIELAGTAASRTSRPSNVCSL